MINWKTLCKPKVKRDYNNWRSFSSYSSTYTPKHNSGYYTGIPKSHYFLTALSNGSYLAKLIYRTANAKPVIVAQGSRDRCITFIKQMVEYEENPLYYGFVHISANSYKVMLHFADKSRDKMIFIGKLDDCMEFIGTSLSGTRY